MTRVMAFDDSAVRSMARLCLLATLLLAFAATGVSADSPEDRRLDPDEFREGLKARGLRDLLELHLRDLPPENDADGALFRREMLLVEFADTSRPQTERDAALAEANQILRELLERHPRSPDALQWRMDLASSLLYQRAERHCVSILYRGGTADDRQQLARITDEVLEVLDALLALTEAELGRFDRMSLAEYERLERQGRIEQVELLQPRAQYMHRWAVFYRALVRDVNDPRRIDALQSVVAQLRDQTDLLTEPHEESHLQIQSLLLAAMAQRRLGDYAAALELLEEALAAADRLPDSAERRSLDWAVSLARLERVKAFRDGRRYNEALHAVDEFRAAVSGAGADSFGLELVAALLESSVLRTQARRAAAAGNDALARRLEARALDPLVVLARKSDAYRDAVYATLYEKIDPQRDPETLQQFERCALIAGSLAESDALAARAAQLRQGTGDDGDTSPEELDAQRVRMLDRAISLGRRLLALGDALDAALRAEVLFNLGVATYRRGDPLEAAKSFLMAGRDHPQASLAPRAAALAVQTAAEVYAQPGLGGRQDVRDCYLEALEVLTEQYAETESARYWRYFRAQMLEDAGRFDEAAGQYAAVERDHENYVRARFLHVRCLAEAAQRLADAGDVDTARIGRRALAAVEAAGDFGRHVRLGKFGARSDTRLTRWAALAQVIEAEMSLLPGAERFEGALERLKEFEQQYPDVTDAVGRVLRVRIIAYEALGQLAEAQREIQRYVASDPERAGPTLQSLFETVRGEIDRLQAAGRSADASKKAADALVLAQEIYDWSATSTAAMTDQDRNLLRLQLAEATLMAGRAEEALRHFEALREWADRSADPLGKDARVVFGVAEAHFQLKRFSQALPYYNRVYQQADANTPLWWRALLGDLSCRSELEQEPEGIVRAIKQHRYLYRGEMGGPLMEARFDALLKTNQERLATSP